MIKPLKNHFKRFGIKNSELRTPSLPKNLFGGQANSELLSKKGFTLIEIIILIVMAAILLPVIITPFATGIRGSQKPEMATRAIYLAHQRMEELMKYNYCNATLNVTVGFVAFTTGGEPHYTGLNEIVHVDRNFSTPSSDVGYKRIIVRVRDMEGSTYDVYSVVTRF